MDYHATINPTPGQIRAARSLLGLSQGDLASIAGVSRRTVVKLENDPAGLEVETVESVLSALRKGGVTFVSADGRLGVLVAAEKPPIKKLARTRVI